MLPCYPSLTFFSPRWSCLACASYPTSSWITFLKKSQLWKKKLLVCGTQTSAAPYQALWFVAPVVRLAYRLTQQKPCLNWLLRIGWGLRAQPQLGKRVWEGGLTKSTAFGYVSHLRFAQQSSVRFYKQLTHTRINFNTHRNWILSFLCVTDKCCLVCPIDPFIIIGVWPYDLLW